jgi:geranylgeranyl transferase type-2 subunit beta
MHYRIQMDVITPVSRRDLAVPTLHNLLLPSQNKNSYESQVTDHFRMSGVYWGLTALYLLGRLDLMDGAEVVKWVLACQKSGGGFGGSEHHDAHLLYTLSALQILALFDKLDLVDADAIASCERGRDWQLGTFACERA